MAGPIEAASPKAPVLLSEATSTWAIALESVSLTGEPFPLTQNIPFSSDPRTRIAVFATNIELLAGEGVNAFTADVQDAAGKRYPLKVEYSGTVPGFPGVTMFIVRLADDLTAVGDVLLGIHLQGTSSNRVRIGGCSWMCGGGRVLEEGEYSRRLLLTNSWGIGAGRVLVLEKSRGSLPAWLEFITDVNVSGVLSFLLAFAGMIVGSLLTQKTHPPIKLRPQETI